MPHSRGSCTHRLLKKHMLQLKPLWFYATAACSTNYAYLLLAQGRQVHLEPLIERWVGTYDLLVHVPIVAGNDAQGDGVRSTDQHFRQAVDDRLSDEIVKRNIDVLRLDPLDRDGWLGVLEEASRAALETPQLELPV